MLKPFSKIYLNKKLSTINLNSQVGKVNLQARKDDGIKAGVYQGFKLGKVLKEMAVGKSERLLKEELRKHGVSVPKRKAIMGLVSGDEDKLPVGEKEFLINGRKVTLSDKQVVGNLRRNAQRDGGFIRGRQSDEVQFGGGKALVTSIGVATNRSVPGAGHIGGNAKDLGVKQQAADFAIQKVNNTKPTASPSPRAPLGGTRPIGM